MNATIVPITERNVTLTLTEREANILKELVFAYNFENEYGDVACAVADAFANVGIDGLPITLEPELRFGEIVLIEV
jgi:hypothetical protein